MKNFSVNLLKVGILLILGLCIFGAMSQVNAAEERVKVHALIREAGIFMAVGDKSSITLNKNMEKNIQNKEDLVLTTTYDEYIVPKENYTVVGFESLNPDIATVNQNGEVTGVSDGEATIRYEIKVSNEQGRGFFYDEVTVEVGETDGAKTSIKGFLGEILNTILNLLKGLGAFLGKMFSGASK